MIAALILAAAVSVPSRPQDFATDTSGSLSAATVSSLNGELQSYYSSTGNTVFVYVAPSTGDTPLEDWTVQAATKWKVGRKGKDDGAILFVFMRDHKVRIEVGYGLEGKLTDAQSSEIIRNVIRPKMRAGDADGAVQSGVDAMLVTITPAYAQKLGHAAPQISDTANGESSSTDVGAIVFIIFIIFLVFIGLAIAYARTPKNKRGTWLMSGPFIGGFGGSSGGSGVSFGGGGFSGGFGGGFGGGGASGGW